MQTRREFLRNIATSIAGGVAIAALERLETLSPPSKISLPERNLFEEAEFPVLSVFGMHDAPNTGGSRNTALAVNDLTLLGAKGLFSIDPSKELMEAVKNAGLSIAIRMIFPENRFDHAKATAAIKKYTDTLQGPLALQPYNEVNNAAIETGGKFLPPEDHAGDILTVAQFTPSTIRILLTPIDQHAVALEPDGNGVAPLDEITYYVRILKELQLRTTPDFLEKRIGLAYHMYAFTPGENPWPRIQKLYALSQQILGVSLPIHITEAGPHQDEQTRFDDATVAKETVRLLTMKIPRELPVKAVYFWTLANFAQRPPDDEQKVNDRVKSFENDAWRRKSGPTEVFNAVAQLSRR